MNAIILINTLAKQANDADTLLGQISDEHPYDATHYVQTETKRNTLYECAKLVETIFHLDPFTVELAFRDVLNHQTIEFDDNRETPLGEQIDEGCETMG